MSHCQSLTEEQVDAVFQRIGKAKEGEVKLLFLKSIYIKKINDLETEDVTYLSRI